MRSASEYIARQGFRWGFGFDVNLTRGQEWLREQHLRGYSSDYSFPTDACTTPIRRGLDNIGFDFTRGRIDPVSFGLDIMKSGKVTDVDIYAPTKPAVGTSAPWALFPNR